MANENQLPAPSRHRIPLVIAAIPQARGGAAPHRPADTLRFLASRHGPLAGRLLPGCCPGSRISWDPLISKEAGIDRPHRPHRPHIAICLEVCHRWAAVGRRPVPAGHLQPSAECPGTTQQVLQALHATHRELPCHPARPRPMASTPAASSGTGPPDRAEPRGGMRRAPPSEPHASRHRRSKATAISDPARRPSFPTLLPAARSYQLQGRGCWVDSALRGTRRSPTRWPAGLQLHCQPVTCRQGCGHAWGTTPLRWSGGAEEA
jgi:hypothetical protein